MSYRFPIIVPKGKEKEFLQVTSHIQIGDLEWYETNGKRLFPIREQDGETKEYVAYLVLK